MFFIKFVETENKVYNGKEALEKLISYIFNPEKTSQDTVRSECIVQQYVSCIPFFFPKEYQNDPNLVSQQMLMINTAYRKDENDIIRHRIISFESGDYVLPNDLNKLAKRIASYYAYKGFATAYGIHMNQYQLHIHFAVCTINMQNGFHMNLKNEFQDIYNLVCQWMNIHEKKLKNQKIKEKYNNILFGDDIMNAGMTAFTTNAQISNNKKFKEELK